MAGLLEYGSLRPADWDEADEMLAQSLRSARQPEMISPDNNVGFRERLTDWVGSQLGGDLSAQRSANRLVQAGEMAVAPLGAANDLSSAQSNFGRGNYVEGVLDTVIGLLGAAPLVGGMISKPAKAARRLLFDAP